jgi:hypothetical protein
MKEIRLELVAGIPRGHSLGWLSRGRSITSTFGCGHYQELAHTLPIF